MLCIDRKSLLGAEQNYYVQLYMENSGKPGDLRVSEVSAFPSMS